MLGKYKNTKKQGDAGLGIAIGWFCTRGYPVSVPLTDSQDYDLVVEVEGVLQKVQIKTTTQTRGSTFIVGLRTLGGNSKQNYVHKLGTDSVYDLLFVVTASDDRYLIPKVDIANKRNALMLGPRYAQYKI